MRTLVLLLLAVPLAACTSSPSGAACPTNHAPTYASFGRQFMATYCTGCHSARAANRHGAPADQNFDSEADVRAHASDIDGEAAAGPRATNTEMPDMSGPVHVQPSSAERVLLGQFLACEKSASQ